MQGTKLLSVAIALLFCAWSPARSYGWTESDEDPRIYENEGYYNGAANLPLAKKNLTPWLKAYTEEKYAEISWSEVELNPFGILDAKGYVSAGLTINIGDFGVPCAQNSPTTQSCRYWKHLYPGRKSNELCSGGLCYPVDVECDSNIAYLVGYLNGGPYAVTPESCPTQPPSSGHRTSVFTKR
jgi:hypothetical protein